MLQTEKSEHGDFWAAFFNSAANNVQAILQFAGKDVQPEELSTPEFASGSDDGKGNKTEKYDKKWATEDCQVMKTLNKSKKKANLTEQLRVMKTLSKHLPFMGLITTHVENGVRKNGVVKKAGEEMTPQLFGSILSGYVGYLYGLRNYFTHYRHDPVSREGVNFEYLGELFDANIGTAKDRFYPEDKIAKDDSRYNNYRKVKGLETVRDAKGKPVMGENGKPQKRVKLNQDFRFYFWEPDPTTPRGEVNPFRELTSQGLAFFLCLFLEKKTANMLLDSVGIEKGANELIKGFGFDDISEDDRTLLKRIFTITCARLPRTRLESENLTSNQTLGLDIMNYLHKCPNDLYKLLSPEDQHKFQTFSEDQGTETLLKRYGDRFPYLALSVMDRLECFNSLRFCIDMGNFYFRCHSRVQIDGSRIENRRLKKKLTCYTRRQDAVNYYLAQRVAENTLYQTDNLVPAPKAYRTDMLPQYDIGRGSKKENRIGIGLKSLGGSRSMFSQPKLDPAGQIKPNTYKPDAWLSMYDLAPALFLSLHGKGREVEKRIEEYIRSWKGFAECMSKASKEQLKAIRWNPGKETRPEFEARFENQFGLSVKDLPDEFRYYLVNGKIKPIYLKSLSSNIAVPITIDEAAEIWLVNERDYTHKLIRNFKNEQNYDFKLGKGKKRRFTSGYIAGWLVRDFMRFQKANGNPQDGFGKLKSSPDFNVLQSSLALFNSQKDSLKEILKKGRLIYNQSGNHPFLEDALERSGALSSIEGFFKAYLDERLEWLSNAAGRNVYQLRKLYERGEKKRNAAKGLPPANVYLGEMAKQFLDESVCLPRGLFDDLVHSTLKELYPEQYAQDMPKDKPVNFTWLMQKQLKWSGDDQQWFYKELKQSKTASDFKKLFELLGSTDVRYDNEGKKTLNEKLEETYSQRRNDLEKSLKFDKEYKGLSFKEKQEFLDDRMEQDNQKYRRLLNSLRDVWKNIRMSGVQDIVLRGAVCKLLKLPEDKLRLCDVKPEYDLQQQRKERGENPEKVYDGDLSNDAILNMTHDLESNINLPRGLGTIKLKGSMKLKNFGNFYRMRFDPKLVSFLCLYKQFGFDSVDYSYLDLKEFDYYDRKLRPAVFEMVHQLEAKVLEKHPDLDKGTYVAFPIIASAACRQNDLHEALLIMIRNSVSHQYYPEFIPRSDYSPDEKERLTPLFNDELAKVKMMFLKRRESSSEDKPALLAETIHDYAKSLFEDAIALVKQQP